MNRFAAAGLSVEAAGTGSRVLVVVPFGGSTRGAMRCFTESEDIMRWSGVKVRTQNGAETIEFGGRGRIDFRSAGGSLRGISADVVYIDEEADRRLDDAHRDQFYRDVTAVLASSGGEIVRA